MHVRAVYNVPQFNHWIVVLKSEKTFPKIFNEIARNRLQELFNLTARYGESSSPILTKFSKDYIEEDDLMEFLKPIGVKKRNSVDFLGINAVYGCPKDNDPTYMPKALCYIPEDDIIECNI